MRGGVPSSAAAAFITSRLPVIRQEFGYRNDNWSALVELITRRFATEIQQNEAVPNWFEHRSSNRCFGATMTCAKNLCSRYFCRSLVGDCASFDTIGCACFGPAIASHHP